MKKYKVFVLMVLCAFSLCSCSYDNTTEIKSFTEQTSEDNIPGLNIFITTSELNIRKGSSKSFDVIYTARKGEQLEMTGNKAIKDDDTIWYEVIVPTGEHGWCNSNYGITDVVKDTKEQSPFSKQAEIEEALSKLVMTEDKVEQVKWYTSSNFPAYKNSRSFVLPYIFFGENNYYLYIRYNYYGDFLGWEKLVFAIDGERYEKEVKYFSVERDFDGNLKSAESYTEDEPTEQDIEILKKIINSKETIIRFYGDEYSDKYDLTISDSDKKAIKAVMDAYDAICKNCD